MAEFNLPTASSDMSTEQLIDMISKMQKELDWLLNNIDSKNVTELNTNITNISSEDGTTTINGNKLIMTDGTGIRLQMGYDSTSDSFNFILYNESGQSTFEIDSSGNVIIKGEGKIDVATDANIGNQINLGDQSAIGETKSINFSGEAVISTDQGDLVIFSGNSTGDLRMSSARNIFIESFQGDTKIQGEELQINSSDLRHYGNRIGFYGISPKARPQVATQNITSLKVATALEDLGLIELV